MAFLGLILMCKLLVKFIILATVHERSMLFMSPQHQSTPHKCRVSLHCVLNPMNNPLSPSSSDIDEVEATYMRRRFQGLSLEEQRRIAARQKQKRRKSEHFKISTRRSSSATESSKSSDKLTPYSIRAKVRQGNPFGLQVY